MKQVGRLALRSIVYFEVVTTIALAIGLIAVNIVKPGVGRELGARDDEAGRGARGDGHVRSRGVIEHTVPQSFFDAAAKNEVLQVVFFAILFAVALSQVQGPRKTFMLSVCETLSRGDVQVREHRDGVRADRHRRGDRGDGREERPRCAREPRQAGRHAVRRADRVRAARVLPVALIFRVPLRRFVQAVQEPWLIAFSTASSEAALPLAMERWRSSACRSGSSRSCCRRATRSISTAPRCISRWPRCSRRRRRASTCRSRQQLVMMLTLMLTSKGVAAVPRASLVILSGALAQFGLPLEAVAVILGVDALMDMARTSVNVVGNCLATVVMARWEGEFDKRDVPLADAVAGETRAFRRCGTPIRLS